MRSTPGAYLAAAFRVFALVACAFPSGVVAQDLASRTQPCRIPGVSVELRCGRIDRPLDAGKPSGPRIQIHFAVAPARAARKAADPVTFLAGGPGQSAISLAGPLMAMYAPLQNRRDLIFVDQRGTGASAPLQCEEDQRVGLAGMLDAVRVRERLAQCRAELQRSPHGDLAQFGTWQAVDDLDAVRAYLGIERWNLLGASYGTRVGLVYQERYPDRVRRSVLDGLAPPDMALPLSFGLDTQAALETVFRACESQPACSARFGSLRQRWETWLGTLPQTFAVRNPRTAQLESVRLSREMALVLMRRPLYTPAAAAALPAAVDAAIRGDLAGLVGLSGLGSTMPRPMRLALGMHHSVICTEDIPLLGADPLSRSGLNPFQRADVQAYLDACAEWPRGRVPSDYARLSVSRSPVLLLSGGDDPATPPRHAEAVRKALGARARHIVVPHAGHGTLALPCVREAAIRFLQSDEADLAAVKGLDCAAQMPRPPVLLPPQLAGVQP